MIPSKQEINQEISETSQRLVVLSLIKLFYNIQDILEKNQHIDSLSICTTHHHNGVQIDFKSNWNPDIDSGDDLAEWIADDIEHLIKLLPEPALNNLQNRQLNISYNTNQPINKLLTDILGESIYATIERGYLDNSISTPKNLKPKNVKL